MPTVVALLIAVLVEANATVPQQYGPKKRRKVEPARRMRLARIGGGGQRVALTPRFSGPCCPARMVRPAIKCIETSPALLTPEDRLSNQLDRSDSCWDSA